MHTELFRSPAPTTLVELGDHVRALGLDADAFTACVAGEVASDIRRDIAEARALSIVSTPTFLLGRRLADGRVKVNQRFSGARPVQMFREAVNELLNKREVSADGTRQGER
jgi:predicted DsbA family dithiol-disulfide isomerase